MYSTEKPELPVFLKKNNRLRLSACTVWCLLVCIMPGYAQLQNPAATVVFMDANNLPLEKVFLMIEKQTPFRFAYSTELIQQQKNITYRAPAIRLPELLNAIFRGTNIAYSIIGNQVVLQKANTSNKITINGFIKDRRTGELLIGAGIFLPDDKTGTVSNNYGFYAVTVPQAADSLNIQVSYVGYTTTIQKISADKSSSIDIALGQPQQAASYVTVVDDRRNDDKLNQLGAIDISGDMLTDGPSVSGNGDIIQSVQMQPGVQSGLEGTPGFFVRGGNAGQNLVQLDEATLYNPSHLFGLVSLFNASAIKKATLLKSGFPASYGDHLSSVLDISMKDGNNQQLGGIIQAGSIVSGITLYGPIKRNKASFLVSARRSMIDLLLQPLGIKNYFSNYALYDVNAKLSWRLSVRDRLFLSFYKGLDKNIFHDETPDSSAITYGNKFGNQAFTFRWNHIYHKKLFSNTSFIYNDYYQSLSAIQDDYFAQLYSGIRDINIKTDLYYYPGKAHKIRAGLNYLHQKLFPATVSDKIPPTGNITNIKPDEIPEKNTNRFAAYLSDDMKLGRRWNIYAGIRVPVFFTKDIQYVNVEPRISLQYMISPGTYFKTSYTQMHQYIHLVQSYNASFPAEIWIGSSNIVQPQYSQQISTGIFSSFSNKMFQTGIEFYYKQMDNQLLFKGGTEPVIDTNLEDNLIFGKASSYGAEFSIRKKKGKLTGWLGYTLAYANQQFDSLHLGEKFPFAYDRRHSFYLAASYAINPHWKVSTDFFAASGRTFTINTAKMVPSGNDNSLYPNDNNNGNGTVTLPDIEVNNYRLTPYNRLDLSISYKKIKQTRNRYFETEWSLSIYNVYAQNNIFLAYRSIDPVTRFAVVKEVSFIPVIPTLTYRYKF